MKISCLLNVRVVLYALLSSVAVLICPAARAHEVLPTIGDMELVDGMLSFKLEGALESFVAGIDLEGLEDTNAAENANDYDALRALPAEDFRQRIVQYWPQMTEEMHVLIDGQEAALTLDALLVEEAPDNEFPRTSTIYFHADVPNDAKVMQLDWPRHYGALVLRQMGVEKGWDGYLTGGLSEPVSLSGGQEVGGWQAFGRYIPVGVAHIIPLGLDHILFVLGLFFLSTHFRPLLMQVTAFTAAHTITLALAALGYVSVPASIVEPIIAASIVYVAVENIFSKGLNPWRPAVIFVFGLLHGLGFASVLGQYGLPENAFIPALLGFNVGVEIGQLAVISVAFVSVFAAIRLSEDGQKNPLAAAIYLGLALVVLPLMIIPISALGPDAVDAYLPLIFMLATVLGLCAASCAVERFDTYRHMVAMPASVGIALIGAYWVVERVFL